MATAAMQQKRAAYSVWTRVSSPPVLADGEIGWDTTNNQARMGNGSSLWASLPVIGSAASVATATTTGTLKLFDNTVQSVAANTVSATASRTYGIQLNSSGQGVVNVPWTDTVYSLPDATSLIKGGVIVGSTLSVSSGTINLPTTGVTATSYTYPNITVDLYGRITSISSGTAPSFGYVGGYQTTSTAGTNVALTSISSVTSASNVALALNSAATTGTNSGNINIQSGSTTSAGNSGSIYVDVGTAAISAGSIGIGTNPANLGGSGNATTIGIGRAGQTTTTIYGTLVASAPAGSLTGNTLASTVTTSSLTSLGTLTGLAIGGNLTFSGTGRQIIGDFDNATLTSRTTITTSTLNAATGVYVTPNGTSTAASIQVSNNSTLTNASKILLATNGTTDVQLVSGINGTGTYLPLSFYTNGAQKMQLATTGNLTLNGLGATLSLSGGSSGTTALQASATASGTLTLPALTGTLAINPTTTIGDLIYTSGTGTPGTLARLAIGTANQVLTVNGTGTGYTWTTPSSASYGYIGNYQTTAAAPTGGTTVTLPLLSTTAVSGGGWTITGGSSSNINGIGGQITLTGGAATAGGGISSGGSISITGGAGNSSSGIGGNVTIDGGTGSSANGNGIIQIGTGTGSDSVTIGRAAGTAILQSGTTTINGQTVFGAGTTSSYPAKFTSGTNLTVPIAGAIEYDGKNLYSTPAVSTATSGSTVTGRGIIPATQLFYVNADSTIATASTSTAAGNVLNGKSFWLAANTVYEVEYYLHTKLVVGSGGASATNHILTTSFPTSAVGLLNIEYQTGLSTQTIQSTVIAWQSNTGSTTNTIDATKAISTTTYYRYRIKGTIKTGATAGYLLVQNGITTASGTTATLTTMAGSYGKSVAIGPAGADINIGPLT